jgi:hypothetical protein
MYLYRHLLAPTVRAFAVIARKSPHRYLLFNLSINELVN